MAFLVWLNQSSFAQWVSGSQSVWAYPTILTVHVLAMAVAAGVGAMISLRILGCWRQIPLAPLEQLYPIIWVGFWSSALTGSVLFVADAVVKARNPAFWGMVVMAVLSISNMSLIRRQVFHQSLTDDRSLPSRAKALAAISVVLWVGTIVVGRMIAYLQG